MGACLLPIFFSRIRTDENSLCLFTNGSTIKKQAATIHLRKQNLHSAFLELDWLLVFHTGFFLKMFLTGLKS